MSESDRDDGVSRRKVLECMTWAGTGVLWTISGGVPHSLGSWAKHRPSDERADLPADQRQSCRLRQAGQSECARHARRGDRQGQRTAAKTSLHDPYRRHQSSVAGVAVRRRRPHHFAVAARRALRSRRARLPRPGAEILSRALRCAAPKARAGTASTPTASTSSGSSMSSISRPAASAISAPTNSNGLKTTSRARSASTPIVVFAHIPLWTVYPDWGWGTDDGAQALSYLKRFGSVTVLNGHIHQVMQKVEGNVTFHTARSTAFPQPAPGQPLRPDR